MDTIIGLLPDSIRKIPTHMDYDGQKKAERIFQFIIILFAVVGFIWGYICQQFSQTVYILGAGLTLASLLTLPPWPMYRRKPLQWQKSREKTEEETSSPQPPSKSQSSSKKKK